MLDSTDSRHLEAPPVEIRPETTAAGCSGKSEAPTLREPLAEPGRSARSTTVVWPNSTSWNNGIRTAYLKRKYYSMEEYGT